MYSRKIITLCAFLALLFGQISLARHSAAHIDHRFSENIIASHDNHNHDEHHHHHHNEQSEHECPECLLTASLQAAVLTTIALEFSVVKSDILIQKPYSFKRNRFYLV